MRYAIVIRHCHCPDCPAAAHAQHSSRRGQARHRDRQGTPQHQAWSCRSTWAVGFERAPKSDKEKAALAAAQKDPSPIPALFVPTPAAACKG
jgi:hypothetical protein